MEGLAHIEDAGPRKTALELSIAGALLLAAALIELVFHRAGWVLGLYSSLGAHGPPLLRGLAAAGQLSVNLVAVLGLVVCLSVLARTVFDTAFGPWMTRVVLAGLATGALVVSSVSVFLSLSPALVLGGYVFAAAAGVLALLVSAAGPLDGGRRRIALGLGLVILLPAAELTARVLGLSVPGSEGAVFMRWSYLLAEVLIVVVPIFAFFTLNLGHLKELARRPPVAALGAALGAVAVAVAVIVRTGDPGYLSVASNRILGITIALPARPVLAVYLAALFFGTLLIGLSYLPRGGRWPDPARRSVGLGLALLLTAGLQPSSPYLFSSMLLGALLVARGLFFGALVTTSRVEHDEGPGAKDALPG